MTSRFKRTGSDHPRRDLSADDIARSYTRFRPGRSTGLGPAAFAALAVCATASVGALIAFTGRASVDAAGPLAQVALGRDAQPVDGDILLGYAAPHAAGDVDPIYLPASGLRPLAEQPELVPGEAMHVARAQQARQAGRRLLSAHPSRQGDIRLAHADARTPSDGDSPTMADLGKTEPVIMTDFDSEEVPSARPRARPAGLVLASSDAKPAAAPAPGPGGLTNAAAPQGLVVEASYVAATGASLFASAEEHTTTPKDGLDASPRPRGRPAALARLARAPAVIETATVETGQDRAQPADPGPVAAQRQIVRAAGCSSRLAAGIPRRPRGAAPGSAIVGRMGSLHGAERDAMIVRELLRGNLPDFLRDLTPVTVSGRLPNGRAAEVTICVTPDYLALGSDDDFIRVPMGLPAAAHVADRFGFLLPTTRMVDAIYAQARLRLSPQPMTPGAQMSSTRYFWQHNETVEGQTRGREERMLTAGQKKDLVLTNRLRSHPGRVAIYGWHKRNGEPIQPLSTVHGEFYSDYSHGVRLVSQTAFVGGRAVALADLLADPDYAQILTGEGPIPSPERLMASLYR